MDLGLRSDSSLSRGPWSSHCHLPSFSAEFISGEKPDPDGWDQLGGDKVQEGVARMTHPG